MKILIVEDNPILRDNLLFLLRKFNYVTEAAENGKVALEKISKSHYDGIILDINMPVMNGKEFLTAVRKKGDNTPVIALTSDSMLSDKLEVFSLGADDYMTKPFEIEELVARLRSIMRRSEKSIDETCTIGNICINYSTCKITKNGEDVNLPTKQYLIIELLTKNKGYPQSKTRIMEYVWGEAEENLDLASTTLESHIYAIRQVLGKDFIRTIKGIGYIIE